MILSALPFVSPMAPTEGTLPDIQPSAGADKAAQPVGAFELLMTSTALSPMPERPVMMPIRPDGGTPGKVNGGSASPLLFLADAGDEATVDADVDLTGELEAETTDASANGDPAASLRTVAVVAGQPAPQVAGQAPELAMSSPAEEGADGDADATESPEAGTRTDVDRKTARHGAHEASRSASDNIAIGQPAAGGQVVLPVPAATPAQAALPIRDNVPAVEKGLAKASPIAAAVAAPMNAAGGTVPGKGAGVATKVAAPRTDSAGFAPAASRTADASAVVRTPMPGDDTSVAKPVTEAVAVSADAAGVDTARRAGTAAATKAGDRPVQTAATGSKMTPAAEAQAEPTPDQGAPVVSSDRKPIAADPVLALSVRTVYAAARTGAPTSIRAERTPVVSDPGATPDLRQTESKTPPVTGATETAAPVAATSPAPVNAEPKVVQVTPAKPDAAGAAPTLETAEARQMAEPVPAASPTTNAPIQAPVAAQLRRDMPGVREVEAASTQDDGDSSDAAAIGLADASLSDVGRVRSASHAAGPSQVHPAQVTRQVAEAIHDAKNGTIEITLSPEELGTVKLSLHHSAQGLQVQLSAERPETADLMRRHLGELERDLKDLGHSSVGFSFSDQPAHRERPASFAYASAGRDAQPASEAETTPIRPRQMASSAGLDIRL